jgi:hypothetical protein
MIRRKTPLKRTTFLKRGGPIKKKPVTEEVKAERKSRSEKDWAFYHRIWASRPHVCQVHDGYKFLGNEIKNYFFDHILDKSKHKHLRYDERNIIIVCGDCHTRKTVGHPTEKHKLAIEKAKEMFGID